MKTKDSKIPWIGEIPEHWKIVRIKNAYDFNIGFTPDTRRTEYYSDELGHEWVTISDICDDKIKVKTKSLISRDFVKKQHKKPMPVGSLLYSFKLTIGKIAVVDRPIFINEAIACFKPMNNSNLDYLRYASFLIQHNANVNIYGAKILNKQLIRDAYITYPPLSEQSYIVKRLDHICDMIENLKCDIEKQIDVLTKYKKSVITEAVLGSKNRNSKLNCSGVNWIKEIPKNWKLIKLKYLYSFRTGLNITKSDLTYDGINVLNYGYIHAKDNLNYITEEKFIQKTDYKHRKSKCKATKGDFIFADTSEDIEGCGNNNYIDKDISVYAGYHTNLLKCNNDNNGKYFAYLFTTDNWRSQIRRKVAGIKVYSITQAILKNIYVTIPPIEEQEEIVEYLDKKCEEIDSIIETKKQQIETLEEYKKSIIYEYVTGKRTV